MEPSITIGKRSISLRERPYFIADIAANHDGDLQRAFKLIELAKEAGANAAKFQNFKAGGASLVCYIDLLASKGNRSLNCMEQYLLEKLSRKRRLGIIDSILCGNDLQRPSRLLSRLVKNSEADIITTPVALERKMYQAVKNLLEAPYYSLEAPYLEENEDE